MTAPTTGRFVWHELHTNDRPKAIKFYSQMMGWEIQDVPMGPGEPYGLCKMNGKDFAGITRSKAPAHVPPHWIPYLAVEDVDAAAARVKELGGKILGAPMNIPNVARFAVVADPQGAAFCVHKHGTPYPVEPEKPPVGAFCWEELLTNDPEAAAKFYGSLFGYGVESMDMGPMGTYRILKRGDRQTAGILKMPAEATHPPSWLSYLATKDVNASTRNAKEIGASVFVEPKDIPEIGRFSVLGDPTGAMIAFFQGA
jgi:uncharacterized protein